MVSFKDVRGKLQKIEVSEEIYKTFDRFELDDLSEMNEYDNHIEHSEVFENNLEVRAKNKPTSLEDEIIRKSTFEELKKAIDMLPEIQKRRIKKYYFEDMTLEEIAVDEKCSKVAIKYSLDIAIKKISEKFKN